MKLNVEKGNLKFFGIISMKFIITIFRMQQRFTIVWTTLFTKLIQSKCSVFRKNMRHSAESILHTIIVKKFSIVCVKFYYVSKYLIMNSYKIPRRTIMFVKNVHICKGRGIYQICGRKYFVLLSFHNSLCNKIQQRPVS